jgi:methylmalonyl-CoA mutase
MIQKDLKHIQLEQEQDQTVNEAGVNKSDFTAEGIELKKTYTAKDIENLEHLDFGAGFAPIYVVIFNYVAYADHGR